MCRGWVRKSNTKQLYRSTCLQLQNELGTLYGIHAWRKQSLDEVSFTPAPVGVYAPAPVQRSRANRTEPRNQGAQGRVVTACLVYQHLPIRAHNAETCRIRWSPRKAPRRLVV